MEMMAPEHARADDRPARDAELDEGNIYECVIEGAKHDLRQLLVDRLDYKPQSLDARPPSGCSCASRRSSPRRLGHASP